MARLSIRHETRYEYQRPVAFGRHRLLLRPRDSHSLRLITAKLQLSLPGDTRWTYDALGNCVCWYEPRGESLSLTIVNFLTLERFPAPLIAVEDPHSTFPVIYETVDRVTLAPFILPVESDPSGALLAWVRGRIGAPTEPVLGFIARMNQTIHSDFTYCERGAEGVQTPAQTLMWRNGTCRDFAWLMVEGLRNLGIAARFVTGYLYDPKREAGAIRGAAATHAWCEVFLPGLGWTEFDPTNGLAESPDLIAVAIARTPAEAAPICGTLVGDSSGAQLHVDVDVHLIPPNEDQAQAA